MTNITLESIMTRIEAALSLAYNLAIFADYIASPFGTRWYIVGQRDGSFTIECCESSCHLEGDDVTEIARSPGVANLDSNWWTEGLAEEDGEYSCAGEVIGPFGAELVRWTVANGDVGSFQDALARIVREATQEAA